MPIYRHVFQKLLSRKNVFIFIASHFGTANRLASQTHFAEGGNGDARPDVTRAQIDA